MSVVLEYLERHASIEQFEERDEALSIYEKTVLFLAFCLLLTFCVIAVWSWILLLLQTIEGGGPLGLIMEILPLHLLL